MSDTARKRTKRNLVIFAVAVLGLAVIGGIIEPYTVPPDAEEGSSGLGQLLWIGTPLAVTLLLRAFAGDGWDDFGLRPNLQGNGFWWLASLCIFPAAILLSTLVGVVFGGVSLDPSALNGIGAAFALALGGALIKNIFEEFAWRGYLAPKVYSLGLNIWLSHAIVGVIWGLWHLPFVYVFWTYLSPEQLWIFVPLFLVGTSVESIAYGEIRLATRSAMPAWAMHSMGNAVGNTILLTGLVQFSGGAHFVFTPGAEGLISIAAFLVAGIWLHRRRTANE